MTSQVHNAVFNTLGAVDQWMKVIGGNVTGSTVTGFRGVNVEFGEVLTAQLRGSAKATDGYGSTNAIQRSDSGIYLKGTSTDYQQGTITSTGTPTHLAINGDAFFILSRSPAPRTIDDISFTRDGTFHFEFLPGPPVAGQPPGAATTGTYRMVNKDGLFVMGYNTPVDVVNRPFGTAPEESQGTDIGSFGTIVTNGPNPPNQPLAVNLQNIQLDHVRNPDAANNMSFDAQGMLRVNGVEPRDLANNQANMHVAIAKFANNQGLDRDGGGAYFSYDIVAGQIFTGTAGNAAPGRVVGASNVISPGAIENSNTSINTTMPEITLAQKSFSAAAKLISVGNGIIDDVNQLVK